MSKCKDVRMVILEVVRDIFVPIPVPVPVAAFLICVPLIDNYRCHRSHGSSEQEMGSKLINGHCSFHFSVRKNKQTKI